MFSETSEEEGKPRYEFIEEEDSNNNGINISKNGENRQQMTAVSTPMASENPREKSPEDNSGDDDGEEQVVFCVSKFNNEESSDEDPEEEERSPSSISAEVEASLKSDPPAEISSANTTTNATSPHPHATQKSQATRSNEKSRRSPRKYDSTSTPNGQTKALPKVAILQRDPSERRREDTNTTTAPSSRGRKAIQVYQPPGQRNVYVS